MAAALACLGIIGCGGNSHRAPNPLALYMDHERRAGHTVIGASCGTAHPETPSPQYPRKWLCYSSPTHVTLVTLSKDGESATFQPSSVEFRVGPPTENRSVSSTP
jgi:hypothetical protein